MTGEPIYALVSLVSISVACANLWALRMLSKTQAASAKALEGAHSRIAALEVMARNADAMGPHEHGGTPIPLPPKPEGPPNRKIRMGLFGFDTKGK